MRIDILQGEVVPRGYGVAWRRWENDTAVCYPIPLNILLAWLRAAWFWARTGAWIKRWDNALHDAYMRGRREERDGRYRDYRSLCDSK